MPNRQSVRYIRKPTTEGGRGTAKQRERIIQRGLTSYIQTQYPDADFYNDWASGAYLTQGQNSARMSLASGNGWVDVFIAEPRRGYHGLFIELKREDVRVYLKDGITLCADPQIRKEAAFLERQNRKGYCARFACGLDRSKALIDWYFENEQPEAVQLPF